MEPDKPLCSRCGASDVRKHGQHLGKQRYYCKSCGFTFTGAEYRFHPTHDINALRAENTKLLKCLDAARRMDNALTNYLAQRTGKTLTRLNAKRERFASLLSGIKMGTHDSQHKPVQDVATTEQGTLFAASTKWR